MSKYREDKPLKENEKFTFQDSQTVEKLLKTQKLTNNQRQAITRLLINYWNMVG